MHKHELFWYLSFCETENSRPEEAVLTIMAYKVRLLPKRVPFFRLQQQKGISRVGELSFWSVKRRKRANRCILYRCKKSGQYVLVLRFNHILKTAQ